MVYKTVSFHAGLIRLNSLALNRLCEGSIDDGVALLTTCLSMALEARNSAQGKELTVQAKQADSLMTVPLEGVFVDEQFPVDAPHSWFCLYQFGFSAHDGVEQDLGMLIALSSYNLAMVHHEIGLFDSDFRRLVKARQYYDVALQYMPTVPSPLFTLAVYNNLGHLSSFFGDTEGIQLCRSALECGKMVVPGFHPAFGASLDRARRFSAPLAPAA